MWDRSLGTVLTCLDSSFRVLAGAPAYVLTDDEKPVTMEHIAGVAITAFTGRNWAGGPRGAAHLPSRRQAPPRS